MKAFINNESYDIDELQARAERADELEAEIEEALGVINCCARLLFATMETDAPTCPDSPEYELTHTGDEIADMIQSSGICSRLREFLTSKGAGGVIGIDPDDAEDVALQDRQQFERAVDVRLAREGGLD